MIFLFWIAGLIMAVLAIPLIKRKVRPNWFYGLRVRATMENENVWYEANERSARILLWVGIGTIVVSSALFPLPWRDPNHYALVCGLLLLVGVIGCSLRAIQIAGVVKRELASSSRSSRSDGEY